MLELSEPWIFFLLFVLAMLAIDLGIFHRKAHAVSLRESVIWTFVWIALALSFNVLIYFWRGPKPALEFLTGYLIEKSLSVDNIFVFLVIFSYFQISPKYQHRVLFWGILGALLFRAIFIMVGVTLIQRFHVMIYFFGLLLVYTGFKMWFASEPEVDPEKNIVLKFLRRFLPVIPTEADGHFLVRRDAKLYASTLLVTLVMVEVSDLIFAVDSIPAILAISHDPFIVFTSNVFAILGLRSLYFALAGFLRMFHLLHYGLSAILTFVGVKMLISHFYQIPIGASLGVVGGLLVLAVVASLVWPPKPDDSGPLPPPIDLNETLPAIKPGSGKEDT